MTTEQEGKRTWRWVTCTGRKRAEEGLSAWQASKIGGKTGRRGGAMRCIVVGAEESAKQDASDRERPWRR